MSLVDPCRSRSSDECSGRQVSHLYIVAVVWARQPVGPGWTTWSRPVGPTVLTPAVLTPVGCAAEEPSHKRRMAGCYDRRRRRGA